VVVSLFFSWKAGRLSWTMLETCFLQTARTTGMIMLILAAAFVLNLLISLSGVAETMTRSVTSLGLSATAMLLVLIVFYLLLGMFMDVMSMLVATDPIWFGIFIILMCELALITPPVGMNLFVVQGIRPDRGGIGEVIRGALPYVVIMMAFTLLLMAVPALVTWLPGKM
jgi:TRAP-type C4-dicarboxylate transport system permease large subunit